MGSWHRWRGGKFLATELQSAGGFADPPSFCSTRATEISTGWAEGCPNDSHSRELLCLWSCFTLLLATVIPVLAGEQVCLEQVMQLAPSCGTVCWVKGTMCLSDSPEKPFL